MMSDSIDVGWAVAGLLFVGSGLGLAVRARRYPAGGLFVAAGSLLIVVGFLPPEAATYAGVAAMAVLTAAVATYPRFTWDLATALTLAGALIGTPLLTQRLARTDGLSVGDLAWIAFFLATIGLSHLWWRLETASDGDAELAAVGAEHQ